MTNQVEVFSAVQDAIVCVLDLPADEVKMESHIVDDLGAESIDFLDISSELEKSLNIEVDFKEIANDNLSNLKVSQVVTYIQKLPN